MDGIFTKDTKAQSCPGAFVVSLPGQLRNSCQVNCEGCKSHSNEYEIQAQGTKLLSGD